MNWDTVTNAKSGRGLGIRRLYLIYLAFMTKLGWRLMEEKESLWAKVLIENSNTKILIVGFVNQKSVHLMHGKDSPRSDNFWKNRSKEW